MAVVRFEVLCYIIIVLLKPSISKLNVPRVLLPIFNEIHTTFTLEDTDDGCYKWTTTRADLIKLTPLEVDVDLDCSPKTIVSTLTKESTRNVAVVLAEDVYTKKILRCDVIVDVIHSLSLVTTTRELFMGEAPEVFEVRAYDMQGNEFSTLEGVEFDWQIIGTTGLEQNVLRFITFKDSQYDMPHSLEEMELHSKKGHMILLEGVKTGTAKVIVRLPHKEYVNIKLDEVQLSVIANLIILPSDVYIMIGDTVHFQIIQMLEGKLEEIELPHTQYYLDAEDKVVASTDKEKGEATGLTEGKTTIALYDRNVAEYEKGTKLPTATITVVQPAYITLNLLPYKNWAILLSEYHDLTVEVYSSTDHKLLLGPNVEIHTQVGDLFHIQQRSKNGSWLTGWGKEEGVATVQAALISVNNPKLGKVMIPNDVMAQAELLIFPPIILSPAEVILPCDPKVKPKYELQIKASGGDGKFLWSSSDNTVGVVTQNGYVRTHTCGYFEVTAVMARNHHNRQSTPFHILPPSHLEIVEFVMEAEVGSAIFLHVALFADKPGKKEMTQIPFTKCQDLPFKVQLSDPNFIYNKSAIITPVGISCANLAIVGLQVGVSRINITYTSEGRLLEDSVTVSTYKPLKLLHPKQCEFVLALGASVHVVFTGGPKPIVGRPSLHKRTVTSQNSSIVEAKDITDSFSNSHQQTSDVTVLEVLCRSIGSSEVMLSMTNSPLLPNCKNQESSSKITVICARPRSIMLQPKVKIADAASCPIDLSANRIVVQNYKDIELDVIITDDEGRPFLNASTLNLNWMTNVPELGEVADLSIGIYSRNVTEDGVIFANGSYQVVIPKGQMGTLEVSTQIEGYQSNRLRAYKIASDWPEGIEDLAALKATMYLYLVDDMTVTPNMVTLYNHPGNLKRLATTQGSGYLQLDLSADNVAEVKYVEERHEIEIRPFSDGELRINVIDLCLVSPPVVVLVNVVSVHVIRVEMSDKIELGKCVSCIVKLYDESDNLLHIPDLDMIDLRYVLETDEIVSAKRLKEDKSKPWGPGEVHYAVTGTELGETKLLFVIGETASAPIDLQVFTPLRIFPRNATLLVGSVLQFTSTGGPRPDANVEYSTSTENIADVSIGGLAEGLNLGRTTIHAAAVGMNPTTGSKVIYSRDTVNLQVIPLIGVTIFAPLTRFRLETTVPIWVQGLPEQLSPVILGSIRPPFRFEWIVDDSEIIEVHGAFKESGIEYLPEDDLSIRVTGLVPGQTTLRLNVVVPGHCTDHPDKSHVVYTASVDLEVFEGLVLTSPTGLSGRLILMAPHSSVRLQTNMDGLVKLRYSLTAPEDPSIKNMKLLIIPNPLVTLSEDGLLTSQAALGRTMVLISATDEQGLEQTLSLIIEVKPIHFMLLNVVTNWHVESQSPIHVVPLGAEFELRVTYHDNTGALFTTGNAELKLRSSRFDLVRIRSGPDNSSVLITTKKPGYTVLKAWSDGIHNTADYIKLHIGQTLSPAIDHLTTGDIICIWTPLVTSVKQIGRWSTSERSLVSVDVKSGIGRVTGFRGGQVSLGHSLHPGASLHLQVIPADQIVMLSSDECKVLTNAPNALVYRTPLVVTTHMDIDKRTNLVNGWQCQEQLGTVAVHYPFDCYLEFTNDTIVDTTHVFILQSGFNIETGQYTCDLLPGPEHSPNISVLYTNVSVWAQLKGTEIEAKPIEIPFVPAIFVYPELVLDGGNYDAVLSVFGVDYVLDHVNVKAVDEHLLGVGEIQRPEKNLLTCKISLLDYHWKLDELGEPLNLIVASKLTDQIVKVHVTIQSGKDLFGRQECMAGKHSPLVSFLYHYRQMLAVIVSMLLIFLVTFYIYTHYLQPVINVNMAPDRSLLCSSVNSGRSPRSPFTNNTCAAVLYAQRFPDAPSNRSSCYENRDPVYGNPNNFYSSSPEIRRSRRFI